MRTINANYILPTLLRPQVKAPPSATEDNTKKFHDRFSTYLDTDGIGEAEEDQYDQGSSDTP
jgi:hypothetical protein